MPLQTPSRMKAQRAEVSEREARRAELEDEDFVRLMRAEWGRRVVARLLRVGRHRAPKFDTNGMAMARQVGVEDFVQSELVNRIFALCPETYATMMRENS